MWSEGRCSFSHGNNIHARACTKNHLDLIRLYSVNRQNQSQPFAIFSWALRSRGSLLFCKNKKQKSLGMLFDQLFGEINKYFALKFEIDAARLSRVLVCGRFTRNLMHKEFKFLLNSTAFGYIYCSITWILLYRCCRDQSGLRSPRYPGFDDAAPHLVHDGEQSDRHPPAIVLAPHLLADC